MTTAVLDTNVIVQAVIGSPRAASARVVAAYARKQFRLVFSLATLEELHAVLMLPKIQQRHGWSDEQLSHYFTFLMANSAFYPVLDTAPASLTRDVTDTKFLSLAEQSQATYLVTNDRRHLLPIAHYHGTSIVSPTKFLASLP